MDIFVLTFGYSGDKLVKLNKCRMWLKGNTVADVTTTEGKLITHNSWKGSRNTQAATFFYGPDYKLNWDQASGTLGEWPYRNVCLLEHLLMIINSNSLLATGLNQFPLLGNGSIALSVTPSLHTRTNNGLNTYHLLTNAQHGTANITKESPALLLLD